MVGVKGLLRLGIKVRPACRNSRISRDGKEATCDHLWDPRMPEVRRARKISPLTHSGVSIASGAIDDAMRPRQFSVVRLAIRATFGDGRAAIGSGDGPVRACESRSSRILQGCAPCDAKGGWRTVISVFGMDSARATPFATREWKMS